MQPAFDHILQAKPARLEFVSWVFTDWTIAGGCLTHLIAMGPKSTLLTIQDQGGLPGPRLPVPKAIELVVGHRLRGRPVDLRD
jgi:hypothetical protein